MPKLETENGIDNESVNEKQSADDSVGPAWKAKRQLSFQYACVNEEECLKDEKRSEEVRRRIYPAEENQVIDNAAPQPENG